MEAVAFRLVTFNSCTLITVDAADGTSWGSFLRAMNPPKRVPHVERLQSLGFVAGKDFLEPMANPFKAVTGPFYKYNGKVTLFSPALVAWLLTSPASRPDDLRSATTTFLSPIFTGLDDKEIEEVQVFCYN